MIRARFSLAVIALLATSISSASSFDKGSSVGRLFRSPDEIDAHSASGAAAPTATPLDRAHLEYLMKHPTEPNYDPLLPLSGEWATECESVAPGPGVKAAPLSRNVIYSSTDHSHFTRTTSSYSDGGCTKPYADERVTFECAEASREHLDCGEAKRESRGAGASAWAAVASQHEPVSLEFVGLPSRHPKKHGSKKRPSKSSLKSSSKPASEDKRTLEIRAAEPGEAAETIHLNFVVPAPAPAPVRAPAPAAAGAKPAGKS